MVSFIEGVFFFYIFVGLYMLSVLVLLYFSNRERLFSYPNGKPEPVSVIMPCFNEERTIGKAIESLLNLDYPKKMIEIIVVDDKSSDNSVNVVKKYSNKYSNVRLIVNKRNSGGAAEPTNIGIKNANHDYVAVADSDSSPDRDALKKMIGFLQKDESVGAVTCSVVSRKPGSFIQKLQSIEYLMIGFGRKLLDLVDAVYVTPGPFALYKKKYLVEVGLFDMKNMTQDIEIVWRLLSHGYKARMCLATKVSTETPKKFRNWWRQRIRWNIGGTQTLIKYRKLVFRKGMLGAFIIPFFSASLFLGVIGLGIFVYLFSRRIAVSYLSTKYSIYASTTILRLQELNFSPSLLNIFGFSLFFMGIFFTLFGLRVMSAEKPDKNFFNIMFYIIVYLSVYPVIMITALYKLMIGRYSW